MKLTNSLYFYPEKGAMDCNTYVVKDKTTVIVDPGLTDYLPDLTASIYKDGIDPQDVDIILNTHLHPDHCWSNESFKSLSGAKILLLPEQKKFKDAAIVKTSQYLGISAAQFQEDECPEGDKLDIGDLELEFIPSPGHSPDSVCFYCRKEKFLICGDVIFSHNTGRVDLPSDSAEKLKQSIEKLSKLDIEYLLPGHMDIVPGAERVKKNFEYITKVVFEWL